MLQNYFKIGWRTIRRNPSNTLIHISGLALGLMAFLLIQQYALFEKSYDDFHEESEQLYRLTTDQVVNGEIAVRDAMSFAPSAAAFTQDLPEVVSATTTYKNEVVIFKKNNRLVEENHVVATDSNFLNLFNYKVLAGDKSTMLSQPLSVVLTQSKAQKYFGNTNPIGQPIALLEDIE